MAESGAHDNRVAHTVEACTPANEVRNREIGAFLETVIDRGRRIQYVRTGVRPVE
jgi:hypothetical protein